MAQQALQAERFDVQDDVWAVNAFFEEKGWTDGLPIIPPTEERVAQMLAAGKRDPNDVIGIVPPRRRQGLGAWLLERLLACPPGEAAGEGMAFV